MPDCSQTSAIARRPRTFCPHCLPPFSSSSHTTLPTPHISTSNTPSPDSFPSPLPPRLAFHFAAATLPTLSHAGTLTACSNATTLSALLAEVVSSLTPEDRNFWCQMMDSLALRVPAGDVNYSVAIAPALLGVCELAYARHCGVLRGRRRGGCVNCTRGVGEFSWVDEEEDEEEEEGEGEQVAGVESSGRMGVASFEGYVCDVLDSEGRREFVRERFYGGGELDTRWLMGKYGGVLGMSEVEMGQYRGETERGSGWWEEEGDEFGDEEYMSGVSDVESVGRSENGGYQW